MWAVLRQVRKHPDVVPVFAITVLGACFATTAIIRSCVFYTDVSFKRKTNPHPWLHIQPHQQTKFIRVNDYNKAEMRRPDFTKED